MKNRKARRHLKAVSKGALEYKCYKTIFSGTKPADLSKKEVAAALGISGIVPMTVDQTPGDFDFSNVHVHFLLDGGRKVCLRWEVSDKSEVVEGTCPDLV